jgi:hypothetical protein
MRKSNQERSMNLDRGPRKVTLFEAWAEGHFSQTAKMVDAAMKEKK